VIYLLVVGRIQQRYSAIVDFLEKLGDGRVAPELEQVARFELRETIRTVIEPCAEIGDRRDRLAPEMQVGGVLATPRGQRRSTRIRTPSVVKGFS
jgi:hypothetical protein